MTPLEISAADEAFLEWLDAQERAEDARARRKVETLTLAELKALHAHYFPATPRWAIADFRKTDFVDAVFDKLRDAP